MRRHVIVVLAIAGVLLAGCGGGSKKASFNEAAAKASVTTAYTTVFATATTPDQAAAYIESGSVLIPTLTQLQNSPQGKAKRSVAVTEVTFPTHTTAAVKFTVTLGGSPFPLTGKAVLQNGTWKVSKDTFCGLVTTQLGGKAPPGC